MIKFYTAWHRYWCCPNKTRTRRRRFSSYISFYRHFCRNKQNAGAFYGARRSMHVLNSMSDILFKLCENSVGVRKAIQTSYKLFSAKMLVIHAVQIDSIFPLGIIDIYIHNAFLRAPLIYDTATIGKQFVVFSIAELRQRRADRAELFIK